ncbi:MAG TPA: hypothetical protein VL979_00005, partial [Solirubrobacteraceae bacterium]|nr:hypothetical protein [Solirubrobacteraceae bacterium]
MSVRPQQRPAGEPTRVNADELAAPEQLSGRTLRSRVALIALAVAVLVALVTLLPGLGGLRSRLAHADPAWLAAGVALKLLSGLGYVAVFRMVFCRRMSWRVSTQVGMAELGANAILPTGGAGGLALGAWALRRGGMDGGHIARRSVAFFFLTSVPNVLGVIVLGVLLALGLVGGHVSLALSLVPALVAAGAVALTFAGRAWAAAAER